jgi:membrane protein implicated in regulation of membrane protease activity
MFAVPDTLAGFYLVCFLLGLVFVAVSAFIGVTHDVAHLPGVHDGSSAHGLAGDMAHGYAGDAGHADSLPGAGHDGPAVGHDASGQSVESTTHALDGTGHSHTAHAPSASPLNMMTIMAFLTWFGGAGYVLHVVYGTALPVSLAGGLAAGIVAGWLVYLFLTKVLLPGTAINPRDHSAVGSLAIVTLPIQKHGVGEIVYTLSGSRHSDGARSVDGSPIPRGTEVVILNFEKGIAQVEPWSRFHVPAPGEKSTS